MSCRRRVSKTCGVTSGSGPLSNDMVMMGIVSPQNRSRSAGGAPPPVRGTHYRREGDAGLSGKNGREYSRYVRNEGHDRFPAQHGAEQCEHSFPALLRGGRGNAELLVGRPSASSGALL